MARAIDQNTLWEVGWSGLSSNEPRVRALGIAAYLETLAEPSSMHVINILSDETERQVYRGALVGLASNGNAAAIECLEDFAELRIPDDFGSGVFEEKTFPAMFRDWSIQFLIGKSERAYELAAEAFHDTPLGLKETKVRRYDLMVRASDDPIAELERELDADDAAAVRGVVPRLQAEYKRAQGLSSLLESFLNETDPVRSEVLATSIARMGTSEAADALTFIARNQFTILDRTKFEHDIATARLLAAHSEDGFSTVVRSSAFRAYSELGAVDWYAFLTNQLTREQDPDVAARIASAIVSTHTNGVLNYMNKTMRTHRFPEVRLLYVNALQTFETTPALRDYAHQMKEDADPRVREAATEIATLLDARDVSAELPDVAVEIDDIASGG